jgi:NAD-dependent deacetylase
MVPIPADLLQTLAKAKNVVVVSGAGISAESEVPTFRDAQSGLWAKYDPAELATPAAFRRDPKLVWHWYCWRREMVLRAVPNAGHQALAQLPLQCGFDEFLLVTQNVDGLHQRAGSREVVELHGSIIRARCQDRGHFADAWPTGSAHCPPRCPVCGGQMRPDVVWFGEALPAAPLRRAMEAAHQCDLLISVGTSSVVYPAAAIADLAIEAGAAVIEINPAVTPLSRRATWSLQGPAGELLPAIIESLRRRA